MFCPLLVIAAQAPADHAVNITTCLGPDCAWWRSDTNACALMAISFSLGVIASAIVNHKQRGGA